MNILPFERSYWVIPNKLIVGEIPTAIEETETIQKLDGLIKANVKLVINLMEEDEVNLEDKPFPDYSHYLNERGVETIRIPIEDMNIPSKETMLEVLGVINKVTEENKIVYVHCWGGIGRTGTVVGCFLKQFRMAHNHNVFEFIDYLKRTTSISKRSSPETQEQRNFIINWESAKLQYE
jgi:protein-tyrosine phosphatase